MINNFNRKLLSIIISLLLFPYCERNKTPFDPSKYNNYPKDRLFTDEELRTKEDPNAPAEKPEWVAWIKENHIPIRSLFCDDFSDLQFLKPLLENKRIVQLGESSHYADQFSQAKVRLIKFLHQECGFDVIAFESPIFECFYTNEHMISMTPIEMMFHSIPPVWWTWEVAPLFEYIIKEGQKTNDPLILSGFDIPMNLPLSISKRPQFLKSVISKVDSNFANKVYQLDSTIVSIYLDSPVDFWDYLAENATNLTIEYENIVHFMNGHMDEFKEVFPDNYRMPLIARQAAWSMTVFINQAVASEAEDIKSEFEFRDKGMADNIDFLLEELYPDSKIIVWAHNFHIRHNNIEVIGIRPELQSMGNWIMQRHRHELYSIGIYMYRGKTGFFNIQTWYVSPAVSGSLESIFYRARKKYCFIDLFHEVLHAGNSWMFEPIIAKGGGIYEYKMVLKDQYDGILFIDTVTPPHYIPWDFYTSIASETVVQKRLRPSVMELSPQGDK